MLASERGDMQKYDAWRNLKYIPVSLLYNLIAMSAEICSKVYKIYTFKVWVYFSLIIGCLGTTVRTVALQFIQRR